MRNALRSSGWEIVDTAGPIIRLPDLPQSAETASLKEKHLLAAGIFPPFLQYGTASRGAYSGFVVFQPAHSRANWIRYGGRSGKLEARDAALALRLVASRNEFAFCAIFMQKILHFARII